MTDQTPVGLPVAEAAAHTSQTVWEALQKAPHPVRELTRRLAGAKGKGLRSLLLLYSAVDWKGTVPTDAVTAGAAVELFHLATLVHDDVIDNAPLRRGAPSLHAAHGVKQAVLCGDYLICLASSLLAQLYENYRQHGDLAGPFARAAAAVCLGELREYQNNGNIDLGMREYLRIISGKTAALFYLSAYAGGVVGGSGSAEAKRLARFGRQLGLAFQIMDDCKDYESTEALAGKPVGKDPAEGVVTLPLICALLRCPELRPLAREALIAPGSVELLAARVRDANGLEDAKALARRYTAKAEKLLTTLPAYKSAGLAMLLEKTVGVWDSFADPATPK